MALSNNLVVSAKDFPALAEAMSKRQPHDKMRLTLEVEVVENLSDRFAFDVVSVESSGAESTPESDDTADDSPLAQTVLGVMSGSKKKK
jgi:hypothetical protein